MKLFLCSYSEHLLPVASVLVTVTVRDRLLNLLVWFDILLSQD